MLLCTLPSEGFTKQHEQIKRAVVRAQFRFSQRVRAIILPNFTFNRVRKKKKKRSGDINTRRFLLFLFIYLFFFFAQMDAQYFSAVCRIGFLCARKIGANNRSLNACVIANNANVIVLGVDWNNNRMFFSPAYGPRFEVHKSG